MANDIGGVWRTIGGRRVFIKDGQDLASAMKESGKFKKKDEENEKYSKLSNNEVYEEAWKLRDETKDYNLKDEIDKRLNRIDRANRKGEGYAEKPTNELREILKNTNKEQQLSDIGKETKSIHTQSEFYKNLNETGKKEYDDFLSRGYSKSDIENTLMYKTQDQRTEEAGVKFASEEQTKDLQNKANELKEKSTEKADKMYKDIEKDSNIGKYSADSDFKKSHHLGWGDYNKDGIPVYDNKIDYKGDFGLANLKTLSNEELTQALNTQSKEYHSAMSEKVGDRRTRNGRMDSIFQNAKVGKYEQGMQKINEEMANRNMPRYNIYDKKNNTLMISSPTKEMAETQLKDMYETDKKLQKSYGWKELPSYKLVEEKDGVDTINKKLQRAGYKKYMKEHPNSKMTFEEYTK